MTRRVIKVVKLIWKVGQNAVIILYEVCSVRKLAVNMESLLIYLYCIVGQGLNSLLEKVNSKVLLFKETKEFEFYDKLFKCQKDFGKMKSQRVR